MFQTPIERVGQGLVMMVKKIITAFSIRNNESFYRKRRQQVRKRRQQVGWLAIPFQIRYDGAVIGGQYTVV